MKGLAHGAAAAPSILQLNVAPGSEVKWNSGARSLVSGPGPAPSVVCGAVVSTVKVRVAGVGSGWSSASVAVTVKVWAPSAEHRGLEGRVAGDRGVAIQGADEGRAGLRRLEFEARRGVVRQPARPRRDRGVGSRGVDREVTLGRRRLDVAGRVGGLHAEGVGAVGECRRDRERARAEGQGEAVDRTMEGHSRLRGGEGEGRRGFVGGAAGPAGDRRFRRRRVDAEVAGQRRWVGVAGRVGRRDRQRVRALGEWRRRREHRAAEDGRLIQRAGERRRFLAGGEGEGRLRRLGRDTLARPAGDRGFRRCGVDGEVTGVADQVAVGADVEAVGTVGERSGGGERRLARA